MTTEIHLAAYHLLSSMYTTPTNSELYVPTDPSLLSLQELQHCFATLRRSTDENFLRIISSRMQHEVLHIADQAPFEAILQDIVCVLDLDRNISPTLGLDVSKQTVCENNCSISHVDPCRFSSIFLGLQASGTLCSNVSLESILPRFFERKLKENCSACMQPMYTTTFLYRYNNNVIIKLDISKEETPQVVPPSVLELPHLSGQVQFYHLVALLEVDSLGHWKATLNSERNETTCHLSTDQVQLAFKSSTYMCYSNSTQAYPLPVPPPLRFTPRSLSKCLQPSIVSCRSNAARELATQRRQEMPTARNVPVSLSQTMKALMAKHNSKRGFRIVAFTNEWNEVHGGKFGAVAMARRIYNSWMKQINSISTLQHYAASLTAIRDQQRKRTTDFQHIPTIQSPISFSVPCELEISPSVAFPSATLQAKRAKRNLKFCKQCGWYAWMPWHHFGLPLASSTQGKGVQCECVTIQVPLRKYRQHKYRQANFAPTAQEVENAASIFNSSPHRQALIQVLKRNSGHRFKTVRTKIKEWPDIHWNFD